MPCSGLVSMAAKNGDTTCRGERQWLLRMRPAVCLHGAARHAQLLGLHHSGLHDQGGSPRAGPRVSPQRCTTTGPVGVSGGEGESGCSRSLAKTRSTRIYFNKRAVKVQSCQIPICKPRTNSGQKRRVYKTNPKTVINLNGSFKEFLPQHDQSVTHPLNLAGGP